VSVATSLNISPAVGAVSSTSISVTPTATTTYTLRAANNVGSVTATTKVTVASAAVPVITMFGANPASIAAGASSTLSWNVAGATSLSISPNVGTVKGTSVRVSPIVTTAYTLLATNTAGSISSKATVTVKPAQPPVIVSFIATPATITSG